jgi:hypothetical protein
MLKRDNPCEIGDNHIAEGHNRMGACDNTNVSKRSNNDRSVGAIAKDQ